MSLIFSLKQNADARLFYCLIMIGGHIFHEAILLRVLFRRNPQVRYVRKMFIHQIGFPMPILLSSRNRSSSTEYLLSHCHSKLHLIPLCQDYPLQRKKHWFCLIQFLFLFQFLRYLLTFCFPQCLICFQIYTKRILTVSTSWTLINRVLI